MSITWVVASDDNGKPMGKKCTHLAAARDVTASTDLGCEDCLREDTTWVHLRECLSCGHIGCCDNSPRRHATAHWHSTAHPLVQSYEPGEQWAWCYPDELFLLPE